MFLRIGTQVSAWMTSKGSTVRRWQASFLLILLYTYFYIIYIFHLLLPRLRAKSSDTPLQRTQRTRRPVLVSPREIISRWLQGV